METAPLAFLAFHPDSAPHEAHELRGDRQPQAGASKTARHGAIHLLERFKDFFVFSGGDADPRVRHREAEESGCFAVFTANLKENFSHAE